MKLTKGKISKIFNKKKQSLKKIKKNKKTKSIIKTFRKKRNINLANKTIKKLKYTKHKGGDINENEDLNTPKNEETIVSPTLQNVNEDEDAEFPIVNQDENVIDVNNDEIFDEGQPNLQESSDMEPSSSQELQPFDEEESPSEEQVVATEEVPEPIPDIKSEQEEPSEEQFVATEEEPSIEQEVPSEEQFVAPEEEPDVEQEVPQEVVTPEEEPVEPVEVPQEVVVPEEEQTVEEEKTISNNREERKNLSESINNVVEYISDKIAEKVSNNLSLQPSEKQQNGFNAIENAAKSIVSTGGNKNKTRKFRLNRKKN